MDPTPVTMKLSNIHCYDEGDSIGSAEPYLWTTFFKIDGDTAHIDSGFTLRGTATVVATAGNHGDLGSGGVDAGENVPIPASLGEFSTLLKPIPLDVPIGGMTDFPGVIGCMVVLLEQDDTPDHAVNHGHDVLNAAVQSALDGLIPTLNAGHTQPTKAEIDALADKVGKTVEDAIGDEVSAWDWIKAFGNMDDKIGSEVFRFSQTEIVAALLAGIDIGKEWDNEGDWEISGHVGAEIDALQVTCVHKPSGRADAHSIEYVGGVYNGSNWRLSKDDIIGWLRDGKAFYVIGPDGSRSEVEYFKHWVSNPNPTGLYITTTPDASKADNLLSLPECPPLGAA